MRLCAQPGFSFVVQMHSNSAFNYMIIHRVDGMCSAICWLQRTGGFCFPFQAHRRGKYSPPGMTFCSFNSFLSQTHPFSLCIPPPSSSPVSSFLFLSLSQCLFPALAFHCQPHKLSDPLCFPQFIFQCFLTFLLLIPPFFPIILPQMVSHRFISPTISHRFPRFFLLRGRLLCLSTTFSPKFSLANCINANK